MSTTAGCVVAIGGGEDTKFAKDILQAILALVPKDRKQVVVIPTASKLPTALADDYDDAFSALGATVEILDLRDRADAEEASAVDRVDEADAVFLTGGDQLRLTSLLGGTELHRALERVPRRGGVLAGTSAGAACMSGTMIIDGDTGGIRRGNVHLAPGLGFVQGCVIDTHFLERGRLGRLLEVIAENPDCLGLGVGADTAMVIRGDRIEAVGRGLVVVVDGHDIRHSNISDLAPEGQVAVEHVVLHTLPHGYSFDTTRRRYLPGSPRESVETAERLEADLQARAARDAQEREEIAQRDRDAEEREQEAQARRKRDGDRS